MSTVLLVLQGLTSTMFTTSRSSDLEIHVFTDSFSYSRINTLGRRAPMGHQPVSAIV